MIYNLPRKAKKKYTWYKYSAADNRNIVTESTRSYVEHSSYVADLPKVLYYDSVEKSGSYIVGDNPIYSTEQSLGLSNYKNAYFKYNGSWYKNREMTYGDNDDSVTVYAYRVHLDDNWAKGTTIYGTVTSTNENAYPEDGYQGGYWYVKKPDENSFEVVAISGASYGFALNSNGYYESNNKGVDNSAAVCRVKIHAAETCTVRFKCINYAESNYDFGLLGVLDAAMDTGYSDVSTNVAKSFKGSSSASVQTYSYTNVAKGDHFIDVKYRKDSSQSSGNDSLQFTLEIIGGVPIYTWEKYSAIDNRKIVKGSSQQYIQRAAHESDWYTFPFYRGVTKSGDKIEGTDFLGRYSVGDGTLDGSLYFDYYGSWYCDRRFGSEAPSFTVVYAYPVYLEGSCAKGTTSYGTVTSEEENTYPENGYYNGYWYVKKT